MPLLTRRTHNQPSGVEPVDQDHLRDCADYSSTRLDNYRLYQDLYDGEPRTILTDRQRRYLEAAGIRWTENFLETVINVTKERMNLVGFKVDGNDDASAWLTSRAWQGNRMDAVQGTVHVNTMVKGDGYVFVTPDRHTGLPRYQYNRPEHCKPVYDDDGVMLYLVKRWSTSARSEQNPTGMLVWRVNLYYPDRVEKYFSLDKDGKHWAHWQDDGDAGWPIWWTENQAPDGDPLGILAVHFRNQAHGRNFGRSDLRGLIPFQHELDKQLLDLFAVMDAQGWQQRWATGVENAAGLRTNPGEVWSGPDGASFGQFAAADPAGPLAAVSATLHRMAAKARTPVHILLMEGQLPSGESMKTANSPLVKKADDRKVDAGNSWEDVQRLGWRVGSVFARDGDVPEFDAAAQITALWDSSEDRNEVSEVTVAAQKQDLGVSRATTLRELGYDPDEEATLRGVEAAAVGPVPPTGGVSGG